MRSRLLRRVVWAVLLTMTAALPVACSSSSGGGDELSAGPVTLRFSWWGADDRHKRTQQVIDLFQKKHPNITVRGEFKDWNSYWDSLATTVAANDAPDVIQMDELYLASYAQRGALLDLNTEKTHLKTADFDPKALATGAHRRPAVRAARRPGARTRWSPTPTCWPSTTSRCRMTPPGRGTT